MNFDKLEISYWEKQKERVEGIRKRIAERDTVVSSGRVVPSDDDLAHGVGRRLDLAILFIDLVGSTSRPAESYDEQTWVLKIYDLFFTEAIRVIEEYGGEVEKNTGDGLMAYFADSWIGSSETCQKRALASVLTLKYVTKNLLNPIIQSSEQSPLLFRAGIDYGPVTIAQIGAARRFGNRVALGTTANVANKMLAGVPDSIVIGENVYKALPEDWKSYCVLHNAETGFLYAKTGDPYRYFTYTGQWSGVL